jgi:Uma2 family endonuclease
VSRLAESATAAPTQVARLGQRIVLHGVSWTTYEQLLADCEGSHAAHFTYDRGALEIMILSFKHETLNRVVATIVEVLAEEMDIDIVNAGSTTFKREDLARAFEPDTAFYIRNAERVRGKDELNLRVDPPPDLVVEIDLMSPSLDKMCIYRAVGVPEIWRYDGGALKIFVLKSKAYREQKKSVALPGLTNEMLLRFIADSQALKRNVWLRHIREWARNRSG